MEGAEGGALAVDAAGLRLAFGPGVLLDLLGEPVADQDQRRDDQQQDEAGLPGEPEQHTEEDQGGHQQFADAYAHVDGGQHAFLDVVVDAADAGGVSGTGESAAVQGQGAVEEFGLQAEHDRVLEALAPGGDPERGDVQGQSEHQVAAAEQREPVEVAGQDGLVEDRLQLQRVQQRCRRCPPRRSSA
ncbi:hypothetical protein [Streptomyces tardus]|uniref:hypothetical protein n=1 Tax=Streptomyces tardus TaxID=2780544 RepID=UPI001C1F6F3C|nr:hypothetical protein [Streptomyces tardus]